MKTWEELKSFDEIITPEMREIIRKVESECAARCPNLRKDGEFFYYCGLDMPEVKENRMEPFNPVYQRHTDLALLQLHCMGNYKTCCYFSGKIKRHDIKV